MAQSPIHDPEFRRIYDESFAAIRSYCIRRLSLADANDAVSEVYMVAWRKRSSIPRESLPWLYGVARNVVRNTQRSARRSLRTSARAQAEPVYPGPGADVVVVRNADDDALVRALESLRNADQEVLRLRAWEGLSAPQIAQVVGCSPAAAEKRLSRAMKRLEAAVLPSQGSLHAAGKEVSDEHGAA